MAEKDYTVEGRQFRTGSDYARALRDKKIIDALRSRTDMTNRGALEKLKKELQEGKYPFYTLLGEDFQEEVEEALEQAVRGAGKQKHGKKPGGKAVAGQGAKASEKRRETGTGKSGSTGRSTEASGKSAGAGRRADVSGKSGSTGRRAGVSGKPGSPELDAIVQEELKRREKRRRLTILLCSVAAAGCLGYFGIYAWNSYRTGSNYEKLSELKGSKPIVDQVEPAKPNGPLYTLDEAPEPKEVLDEYKNLLIKYKKLIGWLIFDDKAIGGESGFPVMQTSDNEYYLKHNMDQEEDKNGTIFLDKDCDVLKPSTNFIVYGHHMKSGRMFGKLDLYEDQKYCEEHPYIWFDTIYEKGKYEVMYVFRSRVYNEDEIVFKYYQFIDANSQQEFDSYMEEMASVSLYDTGVTAEYGDQLLTLSTCDYQEKNGRFVVVAKKIKE
ncbi:MAG: class B sortase [Butyrivibrio sp.]|nr:class B sortase [Acetatifactor muris]MCM1559232.1 class B sortase [Butyrivibrio sp.]